MTSLTTRSKGTSAANFSSSHGSSADVPCESGTRWPCQIEAMYRACSGVASSRSTRSFRRSSGGSARNSRASLTRGILPMRSIDSRRKYSASPAGAVGVTPASRHARSRAASMAATVATIRASRAGGSGATRGGVGMAGSAAGFGVVEAAVSGAIFSTLFMEPVSSRFIGSSMSVERTIRFAVAVPPAGLPPLGSAPSALLPYAIASRLRQAPQSQSR